MTSYRCNLCSYIYDESKENKKWDDLPDDWACPICGSPKSSFSIVSELNVVSTPKLTIETPADNEYECGLCAFIYNEDKEGTQWSNLKNEWTCPVCGSNKNAFVKKPRATPSSAILKTQNKLSENYLAEWTRASDDFEKHMSDIHQMSINGHSVVEPMRTRIPTFSWDEILIKGAQLSKIPLNKSQPVNTNTTIGPGAAKPLIIEMPIIVSHMSFGALSKEAKLAMSKGSSLAKTAICSGEGGILPESLNSAYKYIYEYVPNKYSDTKENLSLVDAVEIKIGQSAKPGMGGHLPGHKVTKEIAMIRGKREGQDITSPSHFPEIKTKDDLKETVDSLRKRTGGKPIGIKLAAGNIEEDIDVALYAGVDFITIDGRAGGTGSALKVVKNSTSVPTIFALARARKALDSKGADNVSLIVTGGMRVSSDIAKALAMGADAVALATATMMAVGCQQYRICNTGKCPVGIATQDPALRGRLNVDVSASRVANFFRTTNDELQDFARLTGNDTVHSLSLTDLCTTNSEVSNHIGIEHV